MAGKSSTDTTLALLGDFLHARREAILNRWRSMASEDQSLPTSSAFSREEFNDTVPTLLNLLGQRLAGQPEEVNAETEAAEHGLHRWHRGYTLHELLKEIEYFHQCLAEEIDGFGQVQPNVEPVVFVKAFQQLIRLNAEVINGSIKQYSDLQRAEAANRVEGLTETLSNLNQALRIRGEHLRRTSHDLRGSFGLIQGAASLLDLQGETEEERTKYFQMLVRNLTAARSIIMQLTDLSRLEAGQEEAEVKPFNATVLLHETTASAQPLAQEKGLILKAEGPDELMVESDPIIVQRIVQNLLLNALQYTQSGWVFVSWAVENEGRWMIGVQDTGPGIITGSAAELANNLQALVERTAALPEPNDKLPTDKSTASGKVSPPKRSKEHRLPGGEGLGLTIVKRLCELINASIDIETEPGRGTLFRVRIPLKGIGF